ncbi:type II secretion system protein [Candidatus Parcubacteria bacterium]|nr:MAG: type II secretion system protein [Candidatus Parcubacteria bacterium]
MYYKTTKGFTLIELLIVVAVIAILAAITVVAFNPLARFQDSRNAQRWADLNSIITAIKLDQIDNGGQYLGNLQDATESLYYQIGTGSACNDTCLNPTVILQTECLDLGELVDEGYLPSIPYDPGDEAASETETRYYIMKSSTGMITVGACSEEKGSNSSIQPIEISR